MERGKETSLETALFGGGDRYALWCTYMNKWDDKHETNINAPPRNADDKWWWAEFGSVAIVLGLTTAAAVTTSLGGVAAAFPIAAVGHFVWTVRKNVMLGIGAQFRLLMATRCVWESPNICNSIYHDFHIVYLQVEKSGHAT